MGTKRPRLGQNRRTGRPRQFRLCRGGACSSEPRRYQSITWLKSGCLVVCFLLRGTSGPQAETRKKPGNWPSKSRGPTNKSKPSRGNGRHGSVGRKKALPRWNRPTPILAVLCCLAMQYASEKGRCEPIMCRATRTARQGREAWFVTRNPQKYGASWRILPYQSAIRSCCLSGSFD